MQSWTIHLSETEENRVKNTIRMIRDAIQNKEELTDVSYEIFVQGSYANNTNVRQNSDIDICVMLTSSFYANYVEGMSSADFGYTDGGMSFQDFREYVVDALRKKFGYGSVSPKNKCIDIDANSYHVNADVVPSLQYRDYKIIHSRDKDKFVEGIKYRSQDGKWIINYPKDHINNGRKKNNDTNYRYKKMVRIMKHIRNDMVSAEKVNGDVISSFLVECLAWNVPNVYITKHDTWNDTLQTSIAYLWNAINDGNANEWGEVSERLYLFRGRKWTSENAKDFLGLMYNYLEFS